MPPGTHLHDAVQIDNVRTVNTHEARGFQVILNMADRGPQEMGFLADVKPDVIAFCFDPIDVADPYKYDAAGGLHEQSFRVPIVAWQRAANLLLRTIHSALEPLAIEGLQEVIRRVDLEGPDGIFVIGGDEHHDRDVIGRKQGHYLEAVDLGHAHIEEHQIG